MTQADKANTFRALHKKGDPVILYNIWDAGTARALDEAGAKALATASWAVAAAMGFDDGENVPFEHLIFVTKRITTVCDLPLTVDLESGFATDADSVARNAARLVEAGAVGFNIEDRRPGDAELLSADVQAHRLQAVRKRCEEDGVPAVINARTDLFLVEKDKSKHAGLIDEAARRALTYREAGADCLFAPGLADPALIKALCQAAPTPVNIFKTPDTPKLEELAGLGVARISYGPFAYNAAMAALAQSAKAVLGT